MNNHNCSALYQIYIYIGFCVWDEIQKITSSKISCLTNRPTNHKLNPSSYVMRKVQHLLQGKLNNKRTQFEYESNVCKMYNVLLNRAKLLCVG